MRVSTSLLLLQSALLSCVYGIDLDLESESSVKDAMSTIVYDMMSYYKGNLTGETPGLLPGPCASTECYYWITAGGMWAQLINYYQYTGDSSYQDTVQQALAFQIGPDKNYNPPNQSKNLGIDDQAFWAFAAMEAAEAGIPNVDDGSTPSWLQLAEAVFNFQVSLWDEATCDGGFRWQVYSFNAGYNLKNIASNGAFFALAARLARYTGNSTYADWASKVYDWMGKTPLLQEKDNLLYVWDNTDASNGCIDVQNYIWTYNTGLLLLGSAMMYNYTNGSSPWRDRVDILSSSALDLFFPAEYDDIMSEVLCEPASNCNSDQSTFKAYLSRWMAVTSAIAPSTAGKFMPVFAKSAEGAAGQCVGGDNGRKCGRQWYQSTWDGTEGVGQQMSALAIIGATQMKPEFAPLRGSESPSSNTTSPNSSNSGNGSGSGGGSGTGGPSAGSRLATRAELLTMLASLVGGSFVWSIL